MIARHSSKIAHAIEKKWVLIYSSFAFFLLSRFRAQSSKKKLWGNLFLFSFSLTRWWKFCVFFFLSSYSLLGNANVFCSFVRPSFAYEMKKHFYDRLSAARVVMMFRSGLHRKRKLSVAWRELNVRYTYDGLFRYDRLHQRIFKGEASERERDRIVRVNTGSMRMCIMYIVK